MEFWGPIPMSELRVRANVVRPGRSVQLLSAELVSSDSGRVVASASAWAFPVGSGPGEQTPLSHTYADGERHPRPEGWHGGYLDAMDWRWIKGAVEEPGPGIVWMRGPDVVAGEAISPTQRLLSCVDSASGASASLDVREWNFLNTELTVHLLRPPVGEWVCLDAETTFAGGSVGLATSSVYDELGLCARSSQALLVVRK